MHATLVTWSIAAATTAAIVLRPWRLPEALWACAGALLLVACGALPPGAALRGIGRGGDVYLFLGGMMLLAEIARAEGVFDWLAARAARRARGSARRLFALVYAVGVVVTVFLSNDATAVVLTPAVVAATRVARVREPLPYVLACALVANAASFVLPISNPANLVVYGARLPPLAAWLALYLLPSIAAIAVTYLVLAWRQRTALAGAVAQAVELPPLGAGGRTCAIGLGAAAAVLLWASATARPLGPPTALAGAVLLAVVCARVRRNPLALLRGVSWGVIPLVAGLFVIVEAIEHIGAVPALAAALGDAARAAPLASTWLSGLLLALACNLVNNLPAGLLVGSTLQQAVAPPALTAAAMIAVDLGPNLSVTGSLATLLWLAALRRDGIHVDARTFLRSGLWVMPPALLLALAALGRAALAG